MSTEIKKQETEITETVIVQEIKLNLDDCEKIKVLSGVMPYKNTRKDSRYDGKFYRTFLYNGIGFTIIEDDKFCKDIDADNLFEVVLQPTENDGKKGYDLISHRTKTKVLSNHKFNVEMKAFTVEFVQHQRTVNPEDYA